MIRVTEVEPASYIANTSCDTIFCAAKKVLHICNFSIDIRTSVCYNNITINIEQIFE